MEDNKRVGKVQTVTDLIDASELGITLAHDHVIFDGNFMYVEPEEASQKDLANQKITLENRGWVGYHWTSNLDNVELKDEALAISELRRFVEAGGRSIVDPTNIGLGREPKILRRIAEATGMNIIMGAGYYLGVTHPDDMSERSEESITEEIIADITIGVDGTQIKAGMIGEIGCAYPWDKNEKKSLRAAVEAHKETGAALMIHPGSGPRLA